MTVPEGSPAIERRFTGTPAFSLDDARNYVRTHRLPMQVASGTEPVIVRTEFLTSKEVSSLLNGEATGFPDDHMLCYVELRGNFGFAGPPGAWVTYNRAFQIFDARSGNLVMGGGLP
jgi:hypothetical protein